ncbi:MULTISPECIES: DUF1830 domain-containing protein [Prochlorococcus]|uniref:DUF1830 domain-containing protein n=1 Tax=Prochlorococcus TaxID=1218 RepID=UPI00055ABCCE|nr:MULTISPECIES: DUF1830 domain-containing protein [Prochlorococcus]
MIEFSYRNKTSSMLVIRCIGPDNYFLERVIFSFETIVFMAPEASKVEIWGHTSYGPTLEQRIRISASSREYPLAA